MAAMRFVLVIVALACALAWGIFHFFRDSPFLAHILAGGVSVHGGDPVEFAVMRKLVRQFKDGKHLDLATMQNIYRQVIDQKYHASLDAQDKLPLQQ